MERAAWRHMNQARRRPLDRQQSLTSWPVETRYRPKQAPGVRVRWPVEQLFGTAILHGPAGVHHQHVIGELCNDPEVMGDQYDRGVELPLKVADQVEDLGLNGDVERGGRLVGDQQVRI